MEPIALTVSQGGGDNARRQAGRQTGGRAGCCLSVQMLVDSVWRLDWADVESHSKNTQRYIYVHNV